MKTTTINLGAASPATVNVWKAKEMQDKLFDVLELLFAEGFNDEAQEMICVLDRVIDKAVA